jgi:hypothetical protein
LNTSACLSFDKSQETNLATDLLFVTRQIQTLLLLQL